LKSLSPFFNDAKKLKGQVVSVVVINSVESELVLADESLAL
jgi:hypothetical protein